MRNRFVSSTSATAGMALALAWMGLTALPSAAQVTKTAAKAALPRTPDGHPDLQGIYDLATMTPIERLPGDPPVLTKEQAEKVQQAELARRTADGGKLDPNRPPLPVGGDKSQGKSFFEILEKAGGGAVGGYDRLWLNQGKAYTVVDGQIRTSIVIDPPDGHVPPFNAAGKKRNAGMRGLPTSDAAEDQDVRTASRPGEYDNPEQRPLSERCLLGFGSTSGPPALPDYFYNDNHQIVQTSDSIMILTEMIHDVRIVRMKGEHLPKNMRFWLGDSVGHWDGDTLVIDTTNFTDKTRFRGSTENLHVVERLKRLDAHTLLYRFTVEDPETWDRPWTGEMTWPATDKPIYEYACHEGNYALGDVMRGARLQESQEAAAKAKK
ncbi:MAG TPA: hypothetical protein VNX18_06230 [Bryobacteraceae bacterium]|jgi:hypothetical protein|nr:hypothetical protein [Bryobacteraceae bacterium]